MSDYADLIEAINTKLKEFEYTEEPNISIANVLYISYVKVKNPFKVRNLCALISLPVDVQDIKTAKRVLDTVRRSILNQYGEAFLWKELEMVYIILADSNLYKLLEIDDGKVVDESGFSLNAMLGSSFINKDNYDNFSHSNWGVYFSSRHFKELKIIIENWCAQKKQDLPVNK